MSETTRVLSGGESPRLFRRKYSIEVLDGADKGKQLETSAAQVTVGSNEHNDLQIGGAAISRHHLRIEVTPRGYLISDLDSTNGSFVGNLRIHSITADKRGAEIKLGDTKIKILPLEEEEEVTLEASDSMGELVGASPVMRELFHRMAKVAPHDTTVLIEGETGTGKELVARELHRASRRKDKPLVVIDCGSIPAGLIESELFGHTKGAFTNATADRPGAFEEANGGTVFLDEIGELEPALQPQLLRVLERGEIKRLGETRYRNVDVRIVAATHRDLRRDVNKKTFRADLYYRLSVARLRVPALRDRASDIPLLANHMLRAFAGDDAQSIDQQTMSQISGYPWPGNVRELRNFIERLSIFSDAEALDQLDDVEGAPPTESQPAGSLLHLDFHAAKNQVVDDFERRYLSELVAATNNNVAEAARRGKMARGHLFKLLKKHGIK